MNSIIISINVNINEKRNEIFLKKSSLTKMKDSLIDQLFFEFSAAISAEIFSTSDLSAMKIALTKSALTILHHFFCRAVKAAFKNIDLSVSANSVSQAVKITSPVCRSHD